MRWNGTAVAVDGQSVKRNPGDRASTRALLALTMALAMALAVLAGPAGLVGTAAASNHPTIEDCGRTIDAAGVYSIESDLSHAGNSACIEVTASDVVIDGNNNTITGQAEEDVGVAVTGGPVSSVTVQNVLVADFDRGVSFSEVSSDGLVENVVVSDASTAGVSVDSASVHIVGSVVDNGGLSSPGDGIVVENSLDWRASIEDTVVQNASVGVDADAPGLSTDSLTTRDNLDTGLRMTGSNYAHADLVAIDNGAHGVEIVPVEGASADVSITGDGTIVSSNGNDGVFSGLLVDSVIDGAVLVENGGSAMDLDAVDNVTVANATLANNGDEGIQAGGGQDLTVENASVTGTDNDPIDIDDIENVLIRSVDLSDIGSDPIIANDVTNLTVTDVSIDGAGDQGIDLDRTTGTIQDTVVANTTDEGILIEGSAIEIVDTIVYNASDHGVAVQGAYVEEPVASGVSTMDAHLPEGVDVLIRGSDTRITENGGAGVYVPPCLECSSPPPTAAVNDATVVNNSGDLVDGGWGIIDATNVNIGESLAPDTRIDAELHGVTLVSVETFGGTSSPEAPPGQEELGRYALLMTSEGATAEGVSTESHEGPPTADVALHYEDGDVDGLDESTVAMWRQGFEDESWVEVPGSLDANANTVSATFQSPEFLAIGLFAEPAPEPTPTPEPPAGGGGSDYEPPGDPDIQVDDVTLSDDDVEPGDSVTVTVDLSNDGDGDGTKNVTLTVNGEEVDSTEVFVGEGDDQTITFSFTADDEGEYDVGVDGEDAGTVNAAVEATTTPTEEPTPTPTEEPTPTETPTESGGGAPTPDDDGGGIGLAGGLILAIGSLLVIGGLGTWAYRQ